MGRDVAGTAGIGVVVPGATETGGFFQDPEVVPAGLLQANRHRQAAKASADHHDFHILPAHLRFLPAAASWPHLPAS